MRRRGPGKKSAIDRVAHCGVGGAGSFGAHVAFGCESRHQIGAGSERCENGAFGNGFLNGLQIFGAGMQKQMDMDVDESRHQSRVTEIDYFCAKQDA